MKTPSSGLRGFDQFWEAWPPNKGNYGRKVNRPACLKVWTALGLEESADEILYSLECWKRSKAWTGDEGQFIPMPTTWLNQERYTSPPRVGPETERAIRLRLRFESVYTPDEREAAFAQWLEVCPDAPRTQTPAFMEWALAPASPPEWRLRA